MHCRSCEMVLEEKLKDVKHVSSINVSYSQGHAEIVYGATPPSHHDLEQAVKDAGYEVGVREPLKWLSRSFGDYRELFVAGLTLLVLYFVARLLGLFNIDLDTSKMAYSFAFVIGLVAGISTCMAIVGGLILGISARHAELHPEATAWQKFRPHLFFNIGRVGGYALLGGLLGALGSFIKISGFFQAILTLAIGLMMVVLGLKLTGISPRLKETALTLPASLSKKLGINRHQKEYNHRSAFITGALTFFLPCGFTQAMQLAAVGSGQFATGAVIMGLFALGTAPALLSIGGLTSVIKGRAARRFYSVVGLAVLLFGLFNINNSLALLGWKPAVASNKKPTSTAGIVDGYQVIRMTQKVNGYFPNSFTVQAGVSVRWIITSESAYSCAASILMPAMNIQQGLKAGENIIEFTPKQTGRLPFSCSMGMYRGEFNVIGAGVDTSDAKVPASFWPGSATAPAVKVNAAGVQKISSRDNGGLSPSEFTVKAGQPVEWTIIPDAPPVGCMVAFKSPGLGFNEREAYPDPTVVRFTPTISGDYDVTCPMGMWRATIHVK